MPSASLLVPVAIACSVALEPHRHRSAAKWGSTAGGRIPFLPSHPCYPSYSQAVQQVR
jgi:hypothetical protein